MQLGSGNGTSFPDSVDTATTEVNAPASGKTKARAEVINDVLSAILAIETSLQDGTGFIKYPSVQNVVTGSRVIGTAYQNTTGRPMTVSVTAYSNAAALLTALTDAADPPTTEISAISTPASGAAGSLTFIVLNGNYYKVTMTGTPTLSYWTEWY